MDIQRLKYFTEVARQRHFSRAAAICRVSQPSLSQQIIKLEQEVGGVLFTRARGRVALTELGKDFLKHAQAILSGVSSAEEFIHRAQDERQRTLRFGAIPTIAPYLIPGLFAAVRRPIPNARFALLEGVTENLTDALLTGQIDFAVWSPPTAIDAECDHLTLARDELLLTLPRAHPRGKTRVLTPAMIANERIILLESAHCLAAQAGAFCAEVGLKDEITMRSSQIDTLLGLVEQGFGLSFTPAIAARAHRHRKVIFRRLTGQTCHREIRLAWLKRRYLTRSQQTVVEAARQVRLDADPPVPTISRR
jgi:LysR family hydrogen peroxide-inducible transcriptional activator